MKGRTSVVIGIRVSDSVNQTLEDIAKIRGVTVSEFIKQKVIAYAWAYDKSSVNTTNVSGEVLKPVNTMAKLNKS